MYRLGKKDLFCNKAIYMCVQTVGQERLCRLLIEAYVMVGKSLRNESVELCTPLHQYVLRITQKYL